MKPSTRISQLERDLQTSRQQIADAVHHQAALYRKIDELRLILLDVLDRIEPRGDGSLSTFLKCHLEKEKQEC